MSNAKDQIKKDTHKAEEKIDRASHKIADKTKVVKVRVVNGNKLKDQPISKTN